MNFRKFLPFLIIFLLGTAFLLSPLPGVARDFKGEGSVQAVNQESPSPGDLSQKASEVRNCQSLEVQERIREQTRENSREMEQVRTRERASEGDQSQGGLSDPNSPRGVKEALNLPQDEIEKLRNQDLGWGEIAIIQLLKEKSGKTVDEILALFSQGYGWGEIASLLGVDFRGIGELVSQKNSKHQRGNFDFRK